MYGFHKINRTPRSQRNSTDSQTWEFSHHKFLRGRADLLDEIKRKALEPDPTVKHRVELPGEMVLMREENRRVWEALVIERKKAERMVGVMKTLWDVVGKGFPGSGKLLTLSFMDTALTVVLYFPLFPRIYWSQLRVPTSILLLQRHLDLLGHSHCCRRV